MAMQVQFIYLTQSEYDNLSTKDESRLYFTSDTHRIYKGTGLYATSTFDQLTANSISASSITVSGNAVALDGHSHVISDVTSLSEILTGVTSSTLTKDTVTADIGYFRLISVSGSANFAVNNVSANAVTVNGTPVSLEGHTHSVADISDFSAATSAFATTSYVDAAISSNHLVWTIISAST